MNLTGRIAIAALLGATTSFAQQPGEAAFRATYKQLIETNTTLSSGSCTLAAERMAARLKTAGIKETDLHFIIPKDKPKEGGLVAVFPGSDPSAKAIDAEFAINEGAGGRLDEAGKPQVHTIQAGEKLPQNYSLEVTNPGGHASRPVKENAINRLAAAFTA